MTGSDLLKEFELQVDDLTELSTAEEYSVLNRVYRKVLRHKQDWRFLHTIHTGIISGTTLALPSDFVNLLDNYNYYEDNDYNNGVYVFVGTDRTPYKVIDIGERNRYRDSGGYCYVDYKNDQIVFTKAPGDVSAEFDYKYRPADITSATSPVIPKDFHTMLVYGMAVEDFIINQSPKAKSYAGENRALYEADLEALSIENDNQV